MILNITADIILKFMQNILKENQRVLRIKNNTIILTRNNSQSIFETSFLQTQSYYTNFIV